MSLPRFSRSLYRDFVTAFKERRLDDSAEPKIAGVPETPRPVSAKRREYLREYVRWLWPHRFAIGFFFLLALLAAGLEMIEPLFMRFIIERGTHDELMEARGVYYRMVLRQMQTAVEDGAELWR
jgi:ATP-binding cassette subfamily B protein/subfamily B ATP-binding cassette protein MsbA